MNNKLCLGVSKLRSTILISVEEEEEVALQTSNSSPSTVQQKYKFTGKKL